MIAPALRRAPLTREVGTESVLGRRCVEMPRAGPLCDVCIAGRRAGR